MTTIADLTSALGGSDGPVDLSASTIGELAAAATSFGSTPLVVQIAERTATATETTLVGTGTVLGHAATVTIAGTIAGTTTAGRLAIVITASFATTFSFARSGLRLPPSAVARAGVPFAVPQPSLLADWDLDDLVLTTDGGGLLASGRLDGVALPVGHPLLPVRLPATRVSGRLRIDDDGALAATLTTDVALSGPAATLLASLGMPLDGVRLGIVADSPTAGAAATSVVLAADLRFGQHIVGVEARLDAGVATVRLRASFDDAPITARDGIEAAAALAGLDGGLPLPSGLGDGIELTGLWVDLDLEARIVTRLAFTLRAASAWTVIEDVLEIDGITAHLDVWFPFMADVRWIGGWLHGRAVIGGPGGVVFDATGELAHGAVAVTGALGGGGSGGVDLTGLLHSLVPDLRHVPAVVVRDARFEASSSGRFALELWLTSDLTVDIGSCALALQSVVLRVLHQPGAGGDGFSAGATVTIGGLPFEISLARVDGRWHVRAAKSSASPLQLDQLVSRLGALLGADVPALPGISLAEVSLAIDDSDVEVVAGTASPITVTVGAVQFEVGGTVRLGSYRDGTRRTVRAHVDGTTTLAGRTVTIGIDLAGGASSLDVGWVARDESDAVDLSTVLDALGLQVTNGPDVRVAVRSFELRFDAATSSLRLAATAIGWGAVEVLARKRVDGVWHVQLWLELAGGAPAALGPGGAPAALGPGGDRPDLGAAASDLAVLQSAFGFERLSLAFATAATGPGTPAARRLDAGLSIVGTLRLDRGDALLGAIGGVVGQTTLTVRAAVGRGLASLVAELDGGVRLSDDLVLLDPRLALSLSPPAASISGSIAVQAGDLRLTATGELTVSATSVGGRLDIAATDPVSGTPGNLLAPLGVRGISLSRIGLLLGIVFAPPSVRLGLQARFGLGDQPPDDNEVAIVIRVIPAAPVPVVNIDAFAFHLAAIDVATVLRVFVDDPPDVPDVIATIVARDVDFRYAVLPTVLPDGSVLDAGFGLTGSVDMFGVHATAAIAIDPTHGARGNFTMDPVYVTVAGLPLVSVTGTAGPTSPVRFAFDTRGPSYLSADAQLDLFGLVRERVTAEVTSSGVRFVLMLDVGAAVHAELSATIAGGESPSFSGHASFDLDLDVEIPLPDIGLDLGTFRLDTELHVLMDINVSGERFSMVFDGDFEFEGLHIDFPRLELNVVPSDLAKIPEILLAAIVDAADDLFGAFVGEITELWNSVSEEIEAAATALAGELEELGEQTAQAIDGLIAGAEATVAAIDEAVQDVLDDVQSLGTQAGDLIRTGLAAAADIHDQAEAVITSIADELRDDLAAADRFVTEVLDQAAALVRRIDAEIVGFLGDASREIAGWLAAADAEAQRILAAAAALAQQLWDEATALVGVIAAEVNRILAEAQVLWAEVERLAAEFARAVEQGAEDVAAFTVDVAEDARDFFVNTGASVISEIGSWF